jgi:hypothetical protein
MHVDTAMPRHSKHLLRQQIRKRSHYDDIGPQALEFRDPGLAAQRVRFDDGYAVRQSGLLHGRRSHVTATPRGSIRTGVDGDNLIVV